MIEPFSATALAALAWQGDAYALRALEDMVRSDINKQERYILYLIKLALPGRDFEVTTGPGMLVGNQVRTSFYTSELFAIANATHPQRVDAVFHALGISRKV